MKISSESLSVKQVNGQTIIEDKYHFKSEVETTEYVADGIYELFEKSEDFTGNVYINANDKNEVIIKSEENETFIVSVRKG